jgi:hypothetical protein
MFLRKGLFHVKHRLLPDTEITKYNFEHILNIDPSGDAPQRPDGKPYVFGRQLRQDRCCRALQRCNTVLEGFSVTRPGQRRLFAHG